jgi:sigma-B regulation protein RsbU (phosphoserine phosphatase)
MIHPSADHSLTSEEGATMSEQTADKPDSVAELREALTQRQAELAILNTVQQGLASHLEVQAIYDLVGDKIRDVFNAQVVMISTYDADSDTMEHRYAIEQGQRVYAPGRFPVRGFRTQIVKTRKPVLANVDVAEEARRIGQPTLPGTITPKSWLGVPMLVGDQVTGILSLQDVERENAFSEADVRLLETFAASMSVALENARLWEQETLYRKSLEREFEIGREMQRGFLPASLPHAKGWEIAASLKAAREVAGDFYDVFKLPGDQLGLVLGDVCDKGLGAALFMTLFRTLMRAASSIDLFTHAETPNSISAGLRLKNAFSLTNNYIVQTHGEAAMFATVFYGILHTGSGVLTYLNGGHVPPVLIDKQGITQELEITGPVVGAWAQAEYEVSEVRIEDEETLFACTDGLSETENPSGELFGQHWELPPFFRGQSLDSSLAEILRSAEGFGSTQHQTDDITMLAVRRRSQ